MPSKATTTTTTSAQKGNVFSLETSGKQTRERERERSVKRGGVEMSLKCLLWHMKAHHGTHQMTMHTPPMLASKPTPTPTATPTSSCNKLKHLYTISAA